MSVWLTVIHDPTLPTDAQRLHEHVVALTEGCPPEPRTLWSTPEPGILVVQAPTAVDRRHAPTASRVTTTPIGIEHTTGERVSFAVIANPSMRRCASGSRTARHPLSADDADDWLRRKLGAALHVTSMTGQWLPAAVGHKTRDRTRVTIARRIWGGEATVTDPVALRDLIIRGVGAGKAYGCGLILTRHAGVES